MQVVNHGKLGCWPNLNGVWPNLNAVWALFVHITCSFGGRQEACQSFIDVCSCTGCCRSSPCKRSSMPLGGLLYFATLRCCYVYMYACQQSLLHTEIWLPVNAGGCGLVLINRALWLRGCRHPTRKCSAKPKPVLLVQHGHAPYAFCVHQPQPDQSSLTGMCNPGKPSSIPVYQSQLEFTQSLYTGRVWIALFQTYCC